MERKWTPGPWVAFTATPWPEQIGCCPLVGRPFSVAGPDNRNVAAASSREIAHLIAAAPDLYEALERLSVEMVFHMDDETVFYVSNALRKARGEA